MAEDKSRYNDMNIILHETDANLSGYRSNSLIVHCFIYFQYHLKLKWMLADHTLNQLLLKLKVLRCFRNLQNETFLRFLKQCRTFNLSNNLYIIGQAVFTQSHEYNYC